MRNLSKTPITQAYFVSNNVIFKINGDIYSNDKCLKENGLAVYKPAKSTATEPYEGQEKLPFFKA